MRKFLTHVFRPGTGRTVPSASCRVKASPSSDASADATVYSDADGLSPISQPFLANANGMVEFYAPDGRYDLYFSIPDPSFGTITYSWTDITISDPSSTSSAATAVQNSHFVVTRQESLLANEIVIPTFMGHPDTPPSSSGTIDNEFDQVDTNWANFNTDLNSSVGLSNGRLVLSQTGTVRTNPVVGFQRPFTEPSGYKVKSLIRFGCDPGVDGTGEISGAKSAWGIGLRDNLGNVVLFGLSNSSQGISVYRGNFNAAGLVDSNSYQQIGSNACYVQIRLASGTYFFEWSQDGFTFITADQIAAASLFSAPIAYVGLFAYASFDTGGSVKCLADFIRQES